MGTSSLASCWSSRACAVCVHVCVSPTGCQGQRSRMQRHQWVPLQSCACPATSSLHCSDCTGPPQHPWAAPQVSPAPLAEAPSNPHAHFICLGERNSLSQLGHLHLQGCQAAEDCSSPANIFTDIFCGCTIYSVVQSHEICRAFHGNHRGFFLKETVSDRKWELYRHGINPLKDIKEVHQNKSRNATLSPWGVGLWKESQSWMHYGARQKEQEEQRKTHPVCASPVCAPPCCTQLSLSQFPHQQSRVRFSSALIH